jgi:hypothetical protein
MADYDVLENTTSAAFLNTVQITLLGKSQEAAIGQSETPSWLIEPTRNKVQDETFETVSSTWHSTSSLSVDLRRISSQLQAVASGTSLFDNSICFTNTEVPGVAGSSRCSKGKSRSPGGFGNQIKRRRIQGTTFPDSQSHPSLCDPRQGREIHECISNLLHMASHGNQTISSKSIECIVKALVSTVYTPMPHQTLCRYHKAVSDRIEVNRLASMEALGLLQSTRTFKLQKLVHKEWQ